LPHELGRLIAVPCPLGFIEDDDAFNWRTNVLQTLVPKVMDVLNERHGLAMSFGLADLFISRRTLGDLVSRQCFLQHAHKRSIAREENGVLNV